MVGEVSESTVLHDFRTAVLTEKNSCREDQDRKPGRGLRRKRHTLRVSHLVSAQLKPGDYIVHKEFGIGTFRGPSGDFRSRTTRETSLSANTRDGDKIFVPVEKLELVQK